MMRKVFCVSGLLIPLVLGASCAAQDETREDATAESSGITCVSVRQINGFNPIDDEFLHVTATGRKHYLFTLDRSCIGIRSASGIAIAEATTRVCSNTLSRVAYRDMGRRQSCRIRNVEEVADRDEARALAEARRAERRNTQADE